MKVLLTGGDTLIGAHLARVLIDSGFSVRVLLPEREIPKTLRGLDIEYTNGTVLSPEYTLDALRGVNRVFHISTLTIDPRAQQRTRAINIEGTRNILIGMARQGIPELVYISSAFCFEPGSKEEPGSEDSPPASTLGLASLDGARKALETVKRFQMEGSLRIITLAPTLTLGRFDALHSAGVALILHAANGKRYPPGGINIVGAQEVARAALSALGRGKPGETYIIAGANVKYSELYAEVREMLGVKGAIKQLSGVSLALGGIFGSLLGSVFPRGVRLTRHAAALAMRDLFYTGEKARNELSIEPRPYTEVLKETISWLKEECPEILPRASAKD